MMRYMVAILMTLVVGSATVDAQSVYDLYANAVFAYAVKGKDECTPIKLNNLEVSACRGARGDSFVQIGNHIPPALY